MTSEIAVFDAGPLIAFHQINRLELLRGLLGRVVAPPAVAQEVAPSVGTLPRWIEEQAIFTLPRFSRSLGAGEREAIALTIQLPADFVVLDDWDARSSAIELGLRVIGSLGSLGLLVRAKKSGQIGEVRPLMDAMISHGLYASDGLYLRNLSLAGENE